MVNAFRHCCLLALGALVLLSALATRAFPQDAPPTAQQNPAPEPPDPLTAVPNRPTFASTAETVGSGVFEIEYGMEAASGHQNINGVLKFGLFPHMELWFTNDHLERDSGVAGVGDSAAGFKYEFYHQSKPVPSLAIFYLAEIPTATANLGTGAMGHSLQLLVSKDFGKHHLDVNYGPNFLGRPGGRGFDRQYFNALSYSHPIAGKWAWTGEIAGYSRANAANPASLILLASALYSVSPRLVLDCGGYFSVYGNFPRFTFAAGATYSVADLYHRRPHQASGRPRRNF
ncbi:MAG TPA: transporter [Candidatus Saccharimonadales bacterium]|nr:transporter [Candidatus Saccharimonadales bacterium]